MADTSVAHTRSTTPKLARRTERRNIRNVPPRSATGGFIRGCGSLGGAREGLIAIRRLAVLHEILVRVAVGFVEDHAPGPLGKLHQVVDALDIDHTRGAGR